MDMSWILSIDLMTAPWSSAGYDPWICVLLHGVAGYDPWICALLHGYELDIIHGDVDW